MPDIPIPPRRAVIFDVDGTLTPENSWTAFTRDLGASVDDHMSIFRQHLSDEIGLDESKVRLLQLWCATGNANRSYIERAFDTWPIRPDALPLVNWLKQRGYLICLITGSVGIYAQYVAARLGVEHWYANGELFFDWRGDLVHFHYTTEQSDVKVAQFLDFCAHHGLNPVDCVAVGDGTNDIGLFELTGRGIMINGSKAQDGYHDKISTRLREVAWQEVSDLTEVQGFLEHLPLTPAQ